jgi:hypothetical protein
VQFISIESYRTYDSLGYHSSGKLERIYHITYNNNVRQLAYVDTLEWTGNNISQLKHAFILQPNKNFVDTYTYDDKHMHLKICKQPCTTSRLTPVPYLPITLSGKHEKK